MPAAVAPTAALLLALAGTAAAAAPPGGRLCVAVGGAAADCGPAEVVWRGRDRLLVRVSDIVYQLRLHPRRVDLVLMHGAMQIDGFSADYRWVDGTLRFDDPDKAVRYEIRPPGGSPG